MNLFMQIPRDEVSHTMGDFRDIIEEGIFQDSQIWLMEAQKMGFSCFVRPINEGKKGLILRFESKGGSAVHLYLCRYKKSGTTERYVEFVLPHGFVQKEELEPSVKTIRDYLHDLLQP